MQAHRLRIGVLLNNVQTDSTPGVFYSASATTTKHMASRKIH